MSAEIDENKLDTSLNGLGMKSLSPVIQVQLRVCQKVARESINIMLSSVSDMLPPGGARGGLTLICY